ncbi:MAG: class I SAM-dependent methyltransferase [Pseudomonadota bacterium]
MHLDVQDLKNFYYRTNLGRVAQHAVREQVAAFWTPAKGETVVGFGFAVPLLRPFLPEARRVVALMPGPQGVMHWPMGEPNCSVLCEETWWPLQSGQADKLVVLHGLETSENPSAVLEECWRVLAPGGRALFIVPNRAGLWSRRDRTPYGFGRPYSLGQLEAQLKRHNFSPEQHLAALFAAPSEKRFWLKLARVMEVFGRRVSGRFAGGVIMVEATKQVYAPRPRGKAVKLRAPIVAGAPAPAGAVGQGLRRSGAPE